MAASATGVRQGDPLGPLFFCLALGPVLRNLADLFPSVHVMSLLDDVTLLGPAEHLPGAMAWLTSQALTIGLRVNTRKSVRLTCYTDVAVADDPRFVEGLRILGCHVGPDEYIAAETQDLLDSYAEVLAPACDLPEQYAMAILQTAVNNRPVYCARTTLPSLAVDAASSFDARLDRAIAKLAGANDLSLPLPSTLLRALPQAHGGLGIPRIAAISPFAFAASLTAAAYSIADRCPSLMSFLASHISSMSSLFMAAEQVIPSCYSTTVDAVEPTVSCSPRPWIPSEVHDPDQGDVLPPPPPPRQRELVSTLVAASVSSLQAMFTANPTALACWRSASFQGSANWLSIPRFPEHRPSRLGMQGALALRLLLPPTSTDPVSRCHRCSSLVSSRHAALCHGLTCPALQGIRTSRHNILRDELVLMLRKVCGPQAVSVEQPIGASHRVDIRVHIGLAHSYVDVSVVHPSTARYVTNASITDGAAAAAREREKHARYDDVLASHGIAPTALVPFVFESSGRLGAEAAAFLDAIKGDATDLDHARRKATIGYYMDSLRHKLLEGNSILLRQGWASLRPLQSAWPPPPSLPPPLPAIGGVSVGSSSSMASSV